jgi:hypothetical protein
MNQTVFLFDSVFSSFFVCFFVSKKRNKNSSNGGAPYPDLRSAAQGRRGRALLPAELQAQQFFEQAYAFTLLPAELPGVI